MANPESNDGPASKSDTAAPPAADEAHASPASAASDAVAPTRGDDREAVPTPGSDDAALPGEEMGFSNSTLHWLSDGDTSRPTTGPYPTTTLPSFDPRAPIAGRRRAVLVVGGAAIVALAVAGTLYVQAGRHPAPPAVKAPDPARQLVMRAEAALAANQVGEAIELAKLALVADPRFADAHFVLATCERARNNLAGARDAYRKYLALAPLGIHAETARAALATLPP